MRSPSFLFLLVLGASVVLLGSTLSATASAQMSDTERKAAARAAYQEGVKLQDDGKFEEALKRFESAQKLFDAPTHLLHVAECQALTGRLVEASETYEILARKSLPAGSPEAFIQAQQQGQAELPSLRGRIPSLRISTKPGPQQLQNLVVNINGVTMPNELLGIARPLNPGTYRFTAQAAGWSTPQSIDVSLAEKETKTAELTLVQGATAPPAMVAQPAPYEGAAPPKAPASGPTSAGLLMGVRAGIVVPGGAARGGTPQETLDLSAFAGTGGGGGVDLYARLVKALLLGITFEYASLSSPSTVAGRTGNYDSSARTTYLGVNLGFIPNVDKVSFIGDVGVGSRSVAQKLLAQGLPAGRPNVDASLSGAEFTLGAGISIPAGPIRLVPKVSLGLGSFSSAEASLANGTSERADIPSDKRAVHTFLFVGLAAYYSLDFGSKPAAP